MTYTSHVDKIDNDLNDATIREKFKTLLAQETVPSELDRIILEMAAQHSTNHQTHLDKKSTINPTENRIAFPKTSKTSATNEENISTAPSSSSGFISPRIWLSLAAGMAAVSLVLVLFYQQKENLPDDMAHHPIPKSEPQSESQAVPVLPQHNELTPPLEEPLVVENTEQPKQKEQPSSLQNPMLVQEQQVTPSPKITPPQPKPTPQSVPAPLIAQEQPVPKKNIQQPTTTLPVENTLPHESFDLMQAQEVVEDPIHHQEHHDLFPASEIIEEDTHSQPQSNIHP